MGAVATEKYLSKSVFFISIGSNDIFEYYHSNSSVPKEQFLSSLVLAYENHLKVTYFSLCFLYLRNEGVTKKIKGWFGIASRTCKSAFR